MTTQLFWATVTSQSPLQVQFDTDPNPSVALPSSLVPAATLMPGVRVQVAEVDQTIVVIGVDPASLQWQPVTVLPGFAGRGAGFNPQVMLDGQGMVHFTGQMATTGLSSITADTPILQLPQGFTPAQQMWWVGFLGSAPHQTYGGYVHTDGNIYFRFDAAAYNPPTTGYFTLVLPAWASAPGQF